MSESRRPSIDEVMEGKVKQQMSRKGWVSFVEGDVANFMNHHQIEKMTLDDGFGNKAKLLRQRDNSIRVECTSSSVL